MTTETKEMTAMDEQEEKILDLLEKYGGRMKELLGSEFNARRMFRIAQLAMGRNPKLKECTAASLLGCILESVRLGFEPGAGAGHSYLIPYNNKYKEIVDGKEITRSRYECQLILDYRAVATMMKRDAGVQVYAAEAVYKNDHFSYRIRAGGPFIEWEPAVGDRGPIIGYVCATWLEDKTLTAVVYKTVQDIEEHSRSKSMSYNSAMGPSGPWKDNPEWMYKKSVIRPAAKLNAAKGTDLQKAVANDELGDLGIQDLARLADPHHPPALEHRPSPKAEVKRPESTQPPAAERAAFASVIKGMDALIQVKEVKDKEKISSGKYRPNQIIASDGWKVTTYEDDIVKSARESIIQGKLLAIAFEPNKKDAEKYAPNCLSAKIVDYPEAAKATEAGEKKDDPKTDPGSGTEDPA